MHGTIDIDIAIDNAPTDYPALAQLLAGYYHQDWPQDHATPDAALQAFAHDASPDTVAQAASDADRLIDAGFDDDGLGRVLADGFDCNYVPVANGVTPTGWLIHVRDTLRPA
ncbi:MAG TPA: contact-dependent growth inhibition system immunity protein [Candidatus Saccharimonadales bacterium]|nr:contact-dependent growth inhibition system immunity protein [Candidatus Saccharimonadales bacterium]